MNKYMYKDRLVTLKFLYTAITRTKIMHKNINFWQTTNISIIIQQQNKLIANNSLRSMNASCLFSQKFHA